MTAVLRNFLQSVTIFCWLWRFLSQYRALKYNIVMQLHVSTQSCAHHTVQRQILTRNAHNHNLTMNSQCSYTPHCQVSTWLLFINVREMGGIINKERSHSTNVENMWMSLIYCLTFLTEVGQMVNCMICELMKNEFVLYQRHLSLKHRAWRQLMC